MWERELEFRQIRIHLTLLCLFHCLTTFFWCISIKRLFASFFHYISAWYLQHSQTKKNSCQKNVTIFRKQNWLASSSSYVWPVMAHFAQEGYCIQCQNIMIQIHSSCQELLFLPVYSINSHMPWFIMCCCPWWFLLLQNHECHWHYGGWTKLVIFVHLIFVDFQLLHFSVFVPFSLILNFPLIKQ